MRVNPELRLQDAIFASIYAISSQIPNSSTQLLIKSWITRYKVILIYDSLFSIVIMTHIKSLLHTIQYFIERAKFDKVVNKVMPSSIQEKV